MEQELEQFHHPMNIFWNGKDSYGDQLAKGVYIYRVVVNDVNGTSVEKTEKLVILK